MDQFALERVLQCERVLEVLLRTLFMRYCKRKCLLVALTLWLMPVLWLALIALNKGRSFDVANVRARFWSEEGAIERISYGEIVF